MARKEDVAWATGFFDGEGSVGGYAGARNKDGSARRYLRVSVAQKDRALLDRYATIFGCGAIYKDKARETHAFQAHGQNAFQIICAMWPYLGEQKRADFKRAVRRIRDSKIATAEALATTPRPCAAADCDTTFTPDKRHAEARYCSGVCAARAARHRNYIPPAPRSCSGCGCHVDDRTYACRRCTTRHWQRRNKPTKEEHDRQVPDPR